MVNAISKMSFSKPMEIHRSDTTGVLASRSSNIFASSGVFGNSAGSAETSGSCASSSGSGGGNTLAIA